MLLFGWARRIRKALTTLLSYICGHGQVASLFATTTEITGILFQKEWTVHSGLKLLVPMLEYSVSQMRQASKEVNELQKVALITTDEITILGIRTEVHWLTSLWTYEEYRPFGRNVLLISGDFHQTLPVVPILLTFASNVSYGIDLLIKFNI